MDGFSSVLGGQELVDVPAMIWPDAQNIVDSACADLLLCNEHTRLSLVSHGASPRFCCGFTQASYMGPERAQNLRAETSAGPGDVCDHTALGGVHPWLRPLVSVGEWVFLRLFSSLGFPTISSQNSPSSTEDCHCSVR